MEKLTDIERQKFLENEKLLYFASKTYGIDFDLCCIGLCKAIKTYDESKGKFSGYAIKSIKNEKLMEIRKKQRQAREILNIDIPLLENKLTYEIKDDEFASNLFEKLIAPCSKRQKQVLTMFYVEHMSYKKIGEKLNISEGSAIMLAVRGRNKIKNRFVTANKTINQILEEI